VIRVGIIGAKGYPAGEAMRWLAGHPEFEISCLMARVEATEPVGNYFPALRGVVEAPIEPVNVVVIPERCQAVILSLPHTTSQEFAKPLMAMGVKVVDLSADFRFRDAAVYESAYQPHAAKDLLAETVYGLSEVYTDEIRNARLVGNPGCYPTSVLLPLVPLVRAGLLDLESIVADSKSGVSGAGRSPSLAVHFCEVTESFKAYKVAAHRHTPEMEAVLSREAGRRTAITFVPHLVPMSRGMLSTIYARPAAALSAQAAQDCIASYYKDRPFVRLRPQGMPPDTLHVRGTNCCDIGVVMDERNRRLVLMAAIDNLVKGAAGQAVQNMNLMFGLRETMGLDQVPFAL
jgi:N-acetyl-gamma-glutamyl-phosphate reductase